MVYEDGPGRWYADLLLKKLPAGVPDAMGTPVATPRSSRKEAVQDAFGVLVGILTSIEDRKRGSHDTKKEDLRIFQLYDAEFSLPAEGVAQMLQVRSVVPGGEEYTVEDGISFLERSVRRILPKGDLTVEDFEAASDEDKNRVLAAMTVLLTMGVFRHPDRRQRDAIDPVS